MEGTYTRNRVAFQDVSSAKLGGGHGRRRGEIPRGYFVTQNYPPYRRVSYPNSGYYSLPAYRK